MAVFTSAIDTADRLLKKYGAACKLRRFTEVAPPDPAKPWIPGAPTPTDYTVYAAFFDYATNKIDGEVIRRGDMQVYMSAKNVSIEPTDADFLVDPNSVVWTIVRPEKLSPNLTEKVLYILQVRR